MTSLSMVRMISCVGGRWTMRQESGGHPTDRWQDKSRSLPSGRQAAEIGRAHV